MFYACVCFVSSHLFWARHSSPPLCFVLVCVLFHPIYSGHRIRHHFCALCSCVFVWYHLYHTLQHFRILFLFSCVSVQRKHCCFNDNWLLISVRVTSFFVYFLTTLFRVWCLGLSISYVFHCWHIPVLPCVFLVFFSFVLESFSFLSHSFILSHFFILGLFLFAGRAVRSRIVFVPESFIHSEHFFHAWLILVCRTSRSFLNLSRSWIILSFWAILPFSVNFVCRTSSSFFNPPRSWIIHSFLVYSCLQDERGFNEFSFDEFEEKLAQEEGGVLAGGEGEEDADDGEADMFG